LDLCKLGLLAINKKSGCQLAINKLDVQQ